MTADFNADQHRSTADCVVDLINPDGDGRIVLVCEHASKFIPPELGKLGLSGAALDSHIAWDPGALAVAKAMSQDLAAPLVAQRISRLVYDCNRAPGAPGAIPERSEIYDIPGNHGVSDEDCQARIDTVYTPFRKALSGCIEQRLEHLRTPPVIVTVHSFTPVYKGVKREFDIGILHDSDSRLADAMLELAQADTTYSTLRNEPYGPDDGVTHTLIEHAVKRGFMNVMIEIRNDLIADAANQKAMADLLSHWVSTALENIAGANDEQQREQSAQ